MKFLLAALLSFFSAGAFAHYGHGLDNILFHHVAEYLMVVAAPIVLVMLIRGYRKRR